MNANQFTQKSMEAVQAAQALAVRNYHQQIEQIHFLAALLEQENGLIPQLLKRMNKTPESLDAAVQEQIRRLPAVTGSGREADKVYITRALDQVFTHAETLASSMKDEFVLVEHLFLALLTCPDSTLERIFDAYRLDKESILHALQSVRGNQRVTTDNP